MADSAVEQPTAVVRFESDGKASAENPQDGSFETAAGAPADGNVEMTDMSARQRSESLAVRSAAMRAAADAFHSVHLKAVPKILLEWKDIEYTVQITKKAATGDLSAVEQGGKFYKKILNKVDGVVRPGELLAIMGASGAGKTTLLNVLARRNRRNTGSVTINGIPLTDEYAPLMAYVQQEDLFMGNLTVREHLLYQARLRMSADIPMKDKIAAVDELMRRLNLSKVANSVIGALQQGFGRGISGGERKRLSFASEILTDPSLLFVDEPTSGLDAFMAEGVIRTLKGIALAGRTVLATIHQPSSEVYALFDRVLLMSEGRTVYLGSREGAVEHFSRLSYACPRFVNPADYFIKVLALVPPEGATGDELVAGLRKERERVMLLADAWDQHVASKGADQVLVSQEERSALVAQNIKPPSRYKRSWFAQFGILFGRALRTEITDPILARAKAGQALFIALIAGLIYLRLPNDQSSFQNKMGAIFFVLINQSMTGVFGVLQTFPLERPIFQREHENGNYGTGAYYWSKMLAGAIPQTIFPAAFVCVVYWMMGLRDEAGPFFAFLGIVLLTTHAAASLGYFVSCCVPDVTVALVLGPVIILPFMLFGGFFINTDSVPIYFKWFETISMFKYGNSALSIVVWDGYQIGCPGLPAGSPACRFTTGNQILSVLGFHTEDLAWDIGALLLIIGVLRLLSYFVLLWRANKRQNE